VTIEDDPFKDLTVRQAAALRLSVAARQAALLARKNALYKNAQAIAAAVVAREEGVGARRIAIAWGVAAPYIFKATQDMSREAEEKKVVHPLTGEYAQNGGSSSADDPALEGVGSIEGQEHLDQLAPGEVDVPRGVFLPPDSDP
jgi:hypothetical protein